jgi:hypothetical protein
VKKLFAPLGVIVLLGIAAPVSFAEVELGFGLTSGSVVGGDANSSLIPNFHLGLSLDILYFSWDAYAMPDYWTNNFVGVYVPSFLNTFDAGLKLVFKPLLLYGEVGPNFLYLRGGQTSDTVGVNLRLGIGLKFRWWGINVSGTELFSSWDNMGSAFGQAWHGNWSCLSEGMTPALNFTLYF